MGIVARPLLLQVKSSFNLLLVFPVKIFASTSWYLALPL